MEEIIKANYACLDEIGMDHERISGFLLNELKGYTFVDDIYILRPGRFLRWFSFDTQKNRFELSKGAIYCKMKKNHFLLCKTFPHALFQLDSELCFIFEKMSDEERMIATALDFANKKKEKN
jgi:hypothetical protein